ncbi:MAG: hypothetical protein JO089_01470 [Alphaproteobacteria bacterium]|nr:hypothetical protein [Alphaproteobacteria bacterium]
MRRSLISQCFFSTPSLPARLAFGVVLGAALLSGCSQQDVFTGGPLAKDAKVTETTHGSELLYALPAPPNRIPVAVYNFDDQTGQFKPNDKITDYSSAVTKGGLAILNNALIAAGNKRWFTVIERGGLKNILQERQIIRAMREQYRFADGRSLPDVPPLYSAAFIIEGGIVGYDSNTVTGGLAASYFGVGGLSQYNSDTVNVYLRLVNVRSGEVMLSTTSSKTIYSMQVQANVFKYLMIDRILQAETGITLNEPVNLAVREAMETAVYSMIMEGAIQGIWNFADPNASNQAIHAYLERKADDGELTPEQLRRREGPLMPPPAPAAVPAPAMSSPQNRAAPVMAAPMAAPSAPPPATPVISPPPPQPAEVPLAQPDHRMSNAPSYSSSVRGAQETTQSTMQPMQPELPAQALPKEPLPEPETPVSPASQPAPAVSRTSDPNALIKYLDDSRYANRHTQPGCELDDTGHCKGLQPQQ